MGSMPPPSSKLVIIRWLIDLFHVSCHLSDVSGPSTVYIVNLSNLHGNSVSNCL